MQRGNSCLRFRRLRHLDESNTARFARIPVLDDSDAFDGSVGREGIAQLLLCHRNIEIPDKEVSHELILPVIFRNACN